MVTRGLPFYNSFVETFEQMVGPSAYDLTKVKNISYRSSGELVVEFDDLDQNKHFFVTAPPLARRNSDLAI